MFRQIKIRHVAEEVFDQIKSAIETGKLKPGEKLPAERELMGQLGVSRVPIREALKLLSNMGLIETRQGGGSYVRALLSDRLLDPLGAIIADSAEKLFELVEVRREIETWSACYAAKEASPVEIADIGRVLREMKMHVDSGSRVPVSLDIEFHRAIAQASLQYDTGAPVPYHPGHIFRLFQAYHRDHLPARRRPAPPLRSARGDIQRH